MDPNHPVSKTSGIKKPSGIPSIQSRLPTSTGTRKSTGIPTTSSSSSLARATTPTQNIDNPPKPSVSSSNLRNSLLPSSNKNSNENLSPSIAAQPAAVANEAFTDKDAIKFKNTIKDLTEKVETLKLKRAEDREKLREYEKSKLQIQQLQEFKAKAQELMSDLNKELQASKQETKTIREQFEEYREEMQNYEQRIEEMTVDKELAEARCEELQDDVSKLEDKVEELKLELDVLKSEIELNGVGGAAASFQSKQLEKEQERLKAALIKLRDLSLQDKTEISSLRKQNEEFSQKVKALIKENESLKQETALNAAQINDLKDQVTATLGSVQIIEQLTEQNLDYEIKINELRDSISDLEAINEVNDQLVESAHEEENELRQNLDMAEMRIREFEKEIEFLKYKIADHERTIVKFRDLVQQLGNEKEETVRKMQLKNDELQSKIASALANNSSSSTNNYDFKQKLIETKNFAKLIENEINKIEIQNLRKYNGYLTSFMSDQFMKRSGDHECILTLLFFKRLLSKTDLILSQIKEKYAHLLNKNDFKANLAEKPEFVFEILMILMLLKLLCNKYDHVLNTCSPKVYTNIGSMYFDFQMHEKVLDLMIDLLQKDQLEDNKKNFDLAEKVCINLQTIYKNHLSIEKFDEIKFLDDFIGFGTYNCDVISIYLQYIGSIINAKDDQTEIIQLLKELSCNNEELKIFLKKAFKFLPKEENLDKKIVLCLPIDLQAKLEDCVNHFIMISKTLKELNYLASSSTSSVSNETSEGGITSKKLEDLAYQACDKVYLIEDNGPYENLRNSINLLHETLARTNLGLESGEYEKELNEEEYKIRKYMINSPVIIASDNFKNTLIEAESLKTKLESKEDEIKEIKRNLKLKVDELSEYKLRISLNENKAENTLKESEEKNKKLLQTIDELKANSFKNEKQHTETIEAMQQELDNFENEIKELKKKIPKKIPFSSLAQNEPISRSLGGASPLSNNFNTGNIVNFNNNNNAISNSDLSLLAQEVKLVRTINKILEKNNFNLKKNLTETMLNKLPSLPKVALIKTDDYKKELDKNFNQKNGENISKLFRQSNDLMKNLYSSLANIKVCELKLKNMKNPVVNLNDSLVLKQEEHMQLKYYHKSARQIQIKVVDLQSDLLKTKLGIDRNIKYKIPFSFDYASENKKCVAEITLPCEKNMAKIVNLNLNHNELKELLKHI